MKNKKFKLLLPSSKCCLKKFLELDFLAKNGSLFIVLLSIAIQSFNIINANNYRKIRFKKKIKKCNPKLSKINKIRDKCVI